MFILTFFTAACIGGITELLFPQGGSLQMERVETSASSITFIFGAGKRPPVGIDLTKEQPVFSSSNHIKFETRGQSKSDERINLAVQSFGWELVHRGESDDIWEQVVSHLQVAPRRAL